MLILLYSLHQSAATVTSPLSSKQHLAETTRHPRVPTPQARSACALRYYPLMCTQHLGAPRARARRGLQVLSEGCHSIIKIYLPCIKSVRYTTHTTHRTHDCGRTTSTALLPLVVESASSERGEALAGDARRRQQCPM